MALSAGTRLGPYEIVSPLGVGGMGEVYRARDSKLGRAVAIKVLPAEVARDREKVDRFRLEARVLASLNHPNVAAIYGFEDSDRPGLVMELVEGPTLADRMIGGRVPVEEALTIAKQVCDALEYAHEHGIVHRDVKPANIKLSPDGSVKLLDFGLAKALESVGANSDISSSPTFTHLGTQAGMILGTAAYMSPEQAKGKAIDRRSDIWAFGCVLFEMLTAKMAFSGETVTETLAEIVKSEPNWSLLPPGTPRTIRTLLQRCLKKDPKQRLQAIGEARIVIEEVLGGKAPPDEQPTQAPASQKRTFPLVGWIGGLVAGVVLVAAFAWWVTRSAAPAKTTVRPLTRLTFNGVSNYPAISPDGKLLAYQAAINGANPQIWVQQIGATKAIQVTHEVNGAFYPAFSPDGTQIAYSSAGDIFEATALGGDVRMVVNDGLYPTYISNGSAMLFWRSTGAHSYPFTIPRMGGTAVQIQPDFGFYFAAISPDGSKLLATAEQIGGPQQDLKHWWLMPISEGKPHDAASPPLLPDETYAPIPLLWTTSDKISGRQWIVFQRRIGGTRNLFRVAVTGEGTVTSPAEQLTFTADSWGPSISANGRMVFLSGDLSTNLWSIPIDANRAQVTGERQSVTQVEGLHDKNPSLSRDGRKVAFFSDRSVVVKDVGTGRETELAENVPAVPGTGPAISPDGSFVLYYVNSAIALDWDLYAISSAGGAPRLVCRACGWPKGFSSDGSRVLTQRGYVSQGLDRIAVVELANGKVTDVLKDPQHNLWHPYYSWDDKWMSFVVQTGADHQRLYITPVENFVPAGADRWIPLTNGDHHDDKPQLSPNGNTIYFTSDRDGFMCMWAMRLDPKTKRPLGAPFAIQHFHGSQRIHSGISTAGDLELNVAKDKIVTSLDEVHSDVWMMDLDPRH